MIFLDSIELPDDLDWPNRYQHTNIAHTRVRALSGVQHIHESTMTKGRKIILEGAHDRAWITKSVLDQLLVLTEQPGLQMTLDYYGQTFNVMLDRESGTGIEATQIVTWVNPSDSDVYQIKINLVEV